MLYPESSCCSLRDVVYDDGGRTVEVQPETQMVEWIDDCVTSGLVAPGVRAGSRPSGRRPAVVVVVGVVDGTTASTVLAVVVVVAIGVVVVVTIGAAEYGVPPVQATAPTANAPRAPTIWRLNQLFFGRAGMGLVRREACDSICENGERGLHALQSLVEPG